MLKPTIYQLLVNELHKQANKSKFPVEEIYEYSNIFTKIRYGVLTDEIDEEKNLYVATYYNIDSHLEVIVISMNM